MPTKRTKPKAIPNLYEDDDGSFNQAPNASSLGSDTPKKFQRLMTLKTYKSQIKQDKDKKMKSKSSMIADNLEQMPDESLNQFNRRVELTLGGGKNMFVSAKKPSQKKEKRKLKRQADQTALLELETQERESKDFYKLRDDIKFGEVALAPPTLTAKPKNRAKNREELIKKFQASNASSNTTNSSEKPKPKFNTQPIGDIIKKKKVVKSPAEKRILETERSRVVEMYRQMKKKQREEHEENQ